MTMPTTTLARANYEKLLNRVQKVLEEGRARAKAALEHEEVRTWWEAARIINETLRRHGGRAAYGKKTVKKLARDLGITEQYLYDVLRFQQHFKILNSSLKLTLTHYRVMTRLEDPRQRHQLYLKVRREHLSVPALIEEIRKRKLLSGPELELSPSPSTAEGAPGKPGGPVAVPVLMPSQREGIRTGGGEAKLSRPLTVQMGDGREPAPVKKFRPLIPRRGKFFTYRIVRPRNLHEHSDFYSVDLGFGNRHDLKITGIKNPKEGDILEAVRIEENPRGDRYRFKRVEAEGPRASGLLYTYQAFVTKVIDNDTLWADIDLGFRFVHKRKLRFRGIDAAEIGKGKRTSDFVKRTLARVPFVVIKVSGRDKFGRPLIDLFYLEGTDDREKVLREGIFLNQQLLDLGLARRVNG